MRAVVSGADSHWAGWLVLSADQTGRAGWMSDSSGVLAGLVALQAGRRAPARMFHASVSSVWLSLSLFGSGSGGGGGGGMSVRAWPSIGEQVASW